MDQTDLDYVCSFTIESPMRITVLLAAVVFLCSPVLADLSAPDEFSSVVAKIRKYVGDGDAPSIAVGLVKNDKLIWAMVIVFLSVLGAVLYYLIRRPERIKIHGQ